MQPVALLLSACAGLSILLIFAGLGRARAARNPYLARIDAIGSAPLKSIEEQELELPFFERTVKPLAQRLSRRTKRFSNTKSVDKMERRLAMAGMSGKMKSSDFVGLRYIISGVTGAITFAILSVLMDPFNGLLFGLLGAGIGYMAPSFWLGRRVRGRQKLILMQIPDALDLLTISVRAGLGFDSALDRVVSELKGPLIDEFRRALNDVRVGSPRIDALRAITYRTNCKPLTNFISAIIQAEKLGVSISKVLQVQSEQLRVERRQRAEEAAAKAPIKMLLPLVGCIFPSLFIVILGPAIIMIMLNLGNVSR